MINNFESLYPKPYVIAELSSNHARNLDIVIKSIEAAAEVGADAIKTQLFKPESLTLPLKECSPRIDDKNSPWNGMNLYELYEEAYLPYEWYPEMIECAMRNDIDLFASVFDFEALDFAIEMKFPIIKVASFELIHTPLIQKVKDSGLPSIISTGMSDFNEIKECVDIFKNSLDKLCLLKCTSDYPASLDTTHIGQMSSLESEFGVCVGLSDHSMSNLPSVIATARGAQVIEKHFILDKSLKTPDSFFSLDQKEFKSLVDDIRATSKMLKIKKLDSIRLKEESHSLWERPSIYFSEDLEIGHKLGNEDFIIRRPSFGLKPNMINSLIGKELVISAKKFTPTKDCYFK